MLDEVCPDCGRQLQKRVGRFGPFVGCSGYPDCKYIKKDPPKSTGVTCPQCKRGRADREAQPVRHDLLQLQPLPGLRLRGGQSARGRTTRAPSAARSSCVVRSLCAAGDAARSWTWSSPSRSPATWRRRPPRATPRPRRAPLGRAAKKPAREEEDRGQEVDAPKKTAAKKATAKKSAAKKATTARRRHRRRASGPCRRSPTRSPRSAGTKSATLKDLLKLPGVLAAAGGDVGLVAGRLGGVRRGHLAGGQPLRQLVESRGPRGRRA